MEWMWQRESHRASSDWQRESGRLMLPSPKSASVARACSRSISADGDSSLSTCMLLLIAGEKEDARAKTPKDRGTACEGQQAENGLVLIGSTVCVHRE